MLWVQWRADHFLKRRIDGVYIQDPQEISLDGSTRALCDEVEAARKRLNASRPFSPDVVARLQRSLLPERIVSTLNIEGIEATRRQTLAIMDAMRLKEAPGRGQVEVRNALEADELVHDLVDQGVEMSEQIPREVNRLLLKGIRADAGSYRRGSVELPGAPNPPPGPTEVPGLMQRLIELFPFADSSDSLLQAAWLHAQFTMIHPFSDGNGRTGRLLQDFALMRRGLLPVGISASRRDDYYASLSAADQGDWSLLVEMLGEFQLANIARTERIAREPAERAAWIQQLANVATKKDRETQHKRYTVWRTRMRGVAQEFAQVAEEIDRASTVIGAKARAFEIPDFAAWQEICRRGQIPRSWLMSITFFLSGRSFYRSILYLRRHSFLASDLFSEQRDLVGIYFTGADLASEEKPSFREYEDPHIRFRELLYVDSNLYAYFDTRADEAWECRDDFTIAEVTRQFFEDVYLRKAGIAA